MLTLEHKIPPPVVALVIMAMMWGLSAFQPTLPLPPEVRLFSIIALVIAAVMFAFLGIRAFRRSQTTTDPLNPDKASALVTEGIFRFSRNPMYVGLALLVSAWAIYLSVLWCFIGPILFILYINRFQIAPEERAMKSKFGDEYIAYTERVRRWL